MPYTRPTLTALRNQVQSDITSNVKGVGSLLRFSNLFVLGNSLAGLTNLEYGYLDWIALMSVPFTAEDEYLEAWAGLKGVTRKPATAATGPAQSTGGVPGVDVPANTIITRNDGYQYMVTETATVDGSGNVTVNVKGILPPIDPVNNPTGNGAISNTDEGVVLTLSAAINGVNSNFITTEDLTGGADIETNDSLRTRMLLVYRAPPQGGSATDYEEWALAVPGVTRAWVTPNGMGVGTVTVRFMMDISEAEYNGFPQGSDGGASGESRTAAATGDQLAVANYIFPLQPVTALVYAVAPIANPVAFTIAGIPGASTATKTAIAAAISAVFLIEGAPGGTVDLSYIEAAIAAVSLTAGFVITEVSCPYGTVTPGSNGNITSNAGYLPTTGEITYTD